MIISSNSNQHITIIKNDDQNINQKSNVKYYLYAYMVMNWNYL